MKTHKYKDDLASPWAEVFCGVSVGIFVQASPSWKKVTCKICLKKRKKK